MEFSFGLTIFTLDILGLDWLVLDGFTIVDLHLILLDIRLDVFALGRQLCRETLQACGIVDGVERVGPLDGSCGNLFLVSK